MIRYNRKLNVFLFFALFSQALSSWAQYAPEKMKGGLFVENKGQWDDNVLYRADIPSGQMYIEKNRFLFDFYDQEAASRHTHGHKDQSRSAHVSTQRSSSGGSIPNKKGIDAHAYEVAFLGCTPISSAQGIDPISYSYNYFKGNDQSKWGSNAHAYNKTVLNDIYPNTSLVCFGQETGFKYEFHLQAGADPSVIQMKYDGVDSVYLKNGELIIETSITDFYEQKPFAYQEINGARIAVNCQFRLVNNTLSFVFPKGYNKKHPLVIDPQLIFSTYSGSFADNWGNSATYDNDGNTYMVGIAFSRGYPVTLGAYQINYRGLAGLDSDLAIMKFDPVGKLLYATYLGGGNTEIPSSCIVNSKKELVLFGFTSSDGIKYPGLPFPTTPGAYDRTYNGGTITYPMTWRDRILFDPGSDLFISTLSANGSALISSTLIGGSLNDGITDTTNTFSQNYGDQFRGEIYCDEADDIYIITKTFSADIVNNSLPGYDKTLDGVMDAYLCKISGNLTKMFWDTYVGGSNEDVGYSIRVAADKSIYITGGTNSSDFPGTATGLNSTYGGNIDGYVAHISADGTSLIQSTYLGTADYDQGFFIQLDALENVYVLGQTLGDYPMSSNVYGQASTGQFIHKIDPTLSTSLLSTTFGNYTDSISIVPTAFLVNNCDNLLISGWGGTTNHYVETYLKGNTRGLEVTSNARYPNTDGSDFYLMVLEKDFKSLLYATFYGGMGEDDHVDGGTSRFDKNGIIYQSVCGSCGGSSEFPVTADAHSITNNSNNCNNACFKYDLTTLKSSFDIDKAQGCGALTVHLTNTSDGGSAYEWDLGDGTKINGPGPITHTYNAVGDYIIKFIVTDLTTCIGKDTSEKTVHVYDFPSIGVNLSDTIICNGDSISVLTNCNPYYTYSWSPTTEMLNPNACDAIFFPSEPRSYYLEVTDTNGCKLKDTININATRLSAGVVWENLTACKGKPTVRLSNPSSGALHYYWTFGDGHTSTETSPVHEYEKGGTYPIAVDVYNDYCATTAVGTVKIDDINIPNLFTPNGDGKNECFEIIGLYPNWRVEVYNAWSKCVFKSDSYKNDFCGDGVSSSVYYYLVCAPYGDCCKSWVQIIQDK